MMIAARKKYLPGINGFTLVEVCMVTIISGLIFVAMYDLYAHYSQQQDKALTKVNIQTVVSEIGDFYNSNNRYPCPSDRTLPYNDPNFGQEVVAPTSNAVTGGTDCDVSAVGLTPGNCYSKIAGITPAGTNGVGGVCMFLCSHGAPPNACGDKTGSANNAILIGGIPINAIRPAIVGQDTARSTNIIYDAWGSQLDYVVTYQLTRSSFPPGAPGTYKFDRGAITVHDENGNDTAATLNNAHYGIISHGRDRIGGYTKYGQMASICGSHVPQSYANPFPAGPGGDDQNCSNTATFIQGIRNDSKTALHYDDFTQFVVITSGGLWQQFSAPDMRNVNLGTVNVGTDGLVSPPPANVVLNVGDPANAGNGILQADNSTNAGAAGIKAAQICDKDTVTGCFPIKAIVAPLASPVITCPPAGQPTLTVMQGISNGLADCVAPSFTAPLPNQACSLGHWLVGITSDGHIICN
jgi:Tfp pilus assembly protein PilE